VTRANRIIDEAAEEAGRSPDAVRRLVNIGGRFGTGGDRLLSGPPDQWAEQLAALTLEYGFGSYILAGDDPAALQIFGREVAPAVRALVAAERASTVPSAGKG
jgi:hypothetical protein